MFKTIDLFAGAGGFSIGLARVGFKVVFANDVDNDASETYKANHPDTPFIKANIADISVEKIKEITRLCKGEIDLLAGGPPCQGFSTVGSKDEHDLRNSLFVQYIRVVEGMLPKFILFENVSGFKRLYQGKAYYAVLKELDRLGYKTKTALIDAVENGLPQVRQRTIIIGYRGNYEYRFPNSTYMVGENHLFLKKALTLEDALSDLPLIGANEASAEYATEPKNDYQRARRKNCKVLTEHQGPNHGAELMKVIKHIPPGGCISDIPEKYRPKTGFGNTYARLWWDKPATTLTRNFGVPSSSRCVHPFRDRGLTTREGARLQSFDDDYQFYGSRSSKNLQIGNAVPPLLAKVIAKSIRESLEGEKIWQTEDRSKRSIKSYRAAGT